MNLFEVLGLIAGGFGVGVAYGIGGGALLPAAVGAPFGLVAGWLIFSRFRKAAMIARLTDEQGRLTATYWLMPISVATIVTLVISVVAEGFKYVAA